MRSIGRYLDEFDIAQEVRMERRTHKGSFLLLEGVTDIKRFSSFTDNSACSSVNSYGRNNAVGALKILHKEGFGGVLAIVDADFDKLLSALPSHDAIIYSETHDLDLDWALPTVVHKYLNEVGDPAKCGSFGSAESIISAIIEGLRPVSIARLLNRKGIIKYKLRDVNFTRCFDGMNVEVSAFVDEVCRMRGLEANENTQIREAINNAMTTEIHDPFQLTNGHDFNCALGVALRNELGSRREVHTWGSEIEAGLRLVYSKEEFRVSRIFLDIKSWEGMNSPYRILASEI